MLTYLTEFKVCKLYEEGVALREISKRVGVSQTTIMSVLRKYDVKLRDKKRISIQKRNLVVELYNQGDTIVDIRKKSGVRSEQTIYRILKEASIVIRKNK